jgi:hypothetical protein
MTKKMLYKLSAVLVFIGLGLVMLSYAACKTAPGAGETAKPPVPPEPLSGPDENFHIYLCFGQSNMEGYNGAYVKGEDGNPIQEQDRGPVDSRFRLLAGQLRNGGTSGMNGIILTLPQTIPTARVIRTDGLPTLDQYHFTPEGYRELGRLYAEEMLSLLGYPLSE